MRGLSTSSCTSHRRPHGCTSRIQASRVRCSSLSLHGLARCALTGARPVCKSLCQDCGRADACTMPPTIATDSIPAPELPGNDVCCTMQTHAHHAERAPAQACCQPVGECCSDYWRCKGTLEPSGLGACRVGPQRSVPASIACPEWRQTGTPWAEMKSKQQQVVPQRTAKEIEGLRAACQLGRRILDAAHAAVKPGATTDDIDKVRSSCMPHIKH